MYAKNQIKIGKFADMLSITVNCLQRLDRENIVPARWTDTLRRYYLNEDYEKYAEIVKKRKLQSHR